MQHIAQGIDGMYTQRLLALLAMTDALWRNAFGPNLPRGMRHTLHLLPWPPADQLR